METNNDRPLLFRAIERSAGVEPLKRMAWGLLGPNALRSYEALSAPGVKSRRLMTRITIAGAARAAKKRPAPRRKKEA